MMMKTAWSVQHFYLQRLVSLLGSLTQDVDMKCSAIINRNISAFKVKSCKSF